MLVPHCRNRRRRSIRSCSLIMRAACLLLLQERYYSCRDAFARTEPPRCKSPPEGISVAHVKVEARQPDAASETRRLQRAITSVSKASLDEADVRPRDLATKLGWTRRQVYNLLQGRKAVRVLDLILIARVLRVNAEVLLRRIVRWE